jgi:hypothetical protein
VVGGRMVVRLSDGGAARAVGEWRVVNGARGAEPSNERRKTVGEPSGRRSKTIGRAHDEKDRQEVTKMISTVHTVALTHVIAVLDRCKNDKGPKRAPCRGRFSKFPSSAKRAH